MLTPAQQTALSAAINAEPALTQYLEFKDAVPIVREDHPAAERRVLRPSDVAAEAYLTAGDRPQHGFEHHRFFEPAGVLPRRLRKVESLSMILRLIGRWGGVTVQPRLALPVGATRGLEIVPLEGPSIAIEWHAVHRPEASATVLAVIETIRERVRTIPLDRVAIVQAALGGDAGHLRRSREHEDCEQR